jgi:protein TonB
VLGAANVNEASEHLLAGDHLFDGLVESRRERGSRLRFVALQVAVAVHVLVLLGIAVEHTLEVPPIHEPPLRAAFAQLAAPPPPPPPPPAPKPAAPKPVPEVETPPPQEMIEPVETPVEISVAPIPESPAVGFGVEGGVEGGVAGGVPGGQLPLEPQVYRVGGPATEPVLVHRVEPAYPRMAATARVQGVVILEAIIRSDGTVGNVKPLRSLSMGLTEAAIDAVRQWRYRPAVLHGVPVDFALTVTVIFKLSR